MSLTLHPEAASTMAPQIDMLFLTLVLFSLALGSLLLFLVVRYSVLYRRGSATDRSGAQARNFWLEASWISVSLVIAFGIFFWGANLFLERDQAPPGSISVLGFGKQWMWRFEHPNGKREINTLHVPIDTPVVVELGSEDVIHSLFIPAFRIKQDAVPGRTTKVWFEATETGTFDLFCAEYCGTEHSEMRGQVVVMPKADFARWLATGDTNLSLAAQGEKLFRSFGCSGCHVPGGEIRAPLLDGVYGNPIALADGSTMVADDAYLRDSVLDPAKQVVAGFDPVMPSFQGLIEEPELMTLIAYIKSLSAKAQP